MEFIFIGIQGIRSVGGDFLSVYQVFRDYLSMPYDLWMSFGGLVLDLWATFGRPLGDLWVTFGRPLGRSRKERGNFGEESDYFFVLTG